MEREFDKKVAVITGAASGMGLLTSQELVKRGASVVMVDICKEALDKTATEIDPSGEHVLPIVCDVRRYEEVEGVAKAALDAFGRIDILVTFAGGAEARCCNSHHPFYEQPIEVIDWAIDVNLKGAVYFSRACMPTMIKQNSGVIITLGSVTGIEGCASSTCYGASKSGLFGFTKGLARAGGPHNVRACCVSPGPVLTRPGMAAMPTILGRAAQPIEIVNLILFLCSEKGAFVTGTNYIIDGGHTVYNQTY